MKDFYRNKKILITGGAGSIGSELVFQIQKLNPKKIIIIDNSEYAIHKLEHNAEFDDRRGEIVLADIKNLIHLRGILNYYKPEIIIHAAAYKHLPILQKNPSEAILNNVMATKNLVDLAREINVERFLFISTDKAVRPSSILGVSKYLAERYIISQENTRTKFYTLRFGNINKSNGSVVEVFEQQIKNNVPLTITHLEVERFFIDLKKACFFLLTTLTIDIDNGIFIFEMGRAKKIIDLAKTTLRGYKLELYKDIKVNITGLKEGEKMKEILYNIEDEIRATEKEDIFQVIEKSKPFTSKLDLDFLIDLSIKLENTTLLKEITKIIKVTNR